MSAILEREWGESEPWYPSANQERAFESAMNTRTSDIEYAREQVLEYLHLESSDVDFWEGDDPEEIEDPEYDDHEGTYYFRHPVYVRLICNDGRCFHFTDGQRGPTQERERTGG